MPNKNHGDLDVKSFVSNYTTSDGARIRFAWNGKHASEFIDANMDFRRTVRLSVLDSIESTPIELVRDLFRAETECSREAWGIVEGVDVLAERLVREDPERFVEDYLTGKFQSFDASCGSAFPVDEVLADKLLMIVRQRLAGDLPETRRRLLESGEELFQEWIDSV